MIPISRVCWSARNQDTAEFSDKVDFEKMRCPDGYHQIKRHYHPVQLRLPSLVGCVYTAHLESATLGGCTTTVVYCTYSTVVHVIFWDRILYKITFPGNASCGGGHGLYSR